MPMARHGAAALLFLGSITGPTWAKTQVNMPCGSFLEDLRENDPLSSLAPTRDVDALNLAMLRDIGEMGNGSARDRQPFSIAPDGHSIAFIVRQAQPVTNDWCQALVILGLVDGAKPLVSYAGKELIRFYHPNLRGMRFPTGLPQLIVPQWSPDGKSIAYLRRENGHTQVWRASVADGDANPVTAGPTDVEQFAWTVDGKGLILGLAQGLADWNEAVEREGLGGFRFDERMMPMARKRPFPPSGLPVRYVVVDCAGRNRDANSEEIEQLGPLPSVVNSTKPVGAVTAPDGTHAWLEAPTDGDISALPRLMMRRGERPRIGCAALQCHGRITGLWWDNTSKSLLYMRQEGEDSLALYRWTGGKLVPRRLFVTQDLLTGCALTDRALLCAREASREPRTLTWVDIETGKQRLLFDPNPDFRNFRLGEVRTLLWTNANGLPAFAVLVLPPDHQTGQKHPLMIVQYTARGFLRGGVGDEYPVHAFAARGYAVLVVQRPDEIAAIAGKKLADRTAATTVNVAGWAERRSVNASLMAAIAQASKQGVVDDARIGITGLSDGASTTCFALINNNIFAAAALSSACEDPRTSLLLAGPRWERSRYGVGFPDYGDTGEFWRPVSIALNAARIKTPLLMQLADDESDFGLEAFSSFRLAGHPIEMYVFPGEHHIKWQPAHRLAIYQRNLDWFDYWLLGKRDDDPLKASQYAAWDALRRPHPSVP